MILVENAFYHNHSVCVFKLLHCEKYKVKVLTEPPSAFIHQIVPPQLHTSSYYATANLIIKVAGIWIMLSQKHYGSAIYFFFAQIHFNLSSHIKPLG